ncbi:MAG: hemerythrin domain-containing protein [Betaproteobacteria bacterium]|nr:hemerythrin domain-containing protein [Betaproteobacteria bacterium]
MSIQTDLWRGEHASFRRLLDLLEAQIGLFHAGAQPNYGLMLDVVAYLRHYPDRFHHPKEDAAVQRLLGREPHAAGLLQRVGGDHRVIEHSGWQLQEQLEAVAAGALLARDAVESTAATYAAYYRQHLAREERVLFPLAERLFDGSDWAAVEVAVPSGRDPLFGAQVEERYRELKRRIALEGACGCSTEEPHGDERGPRAAKRRAPRPRAADRMLNLRAAEPRRLRE